MVADLLVGLQNIEVVAVNAYVTVNGGPCQHNILVYAQWPLQKSPYAESWKDGMT